MFSEKSFHCLPFCSDKNNHVSTKLEHSSVESKVLIILQVATLGNNFLQIFLLLIVFGSDGTTSIHVINS